MPGYDDKMKNNDKSDRPKSPVKNKSQKDQTDTDRLIEKLKSRRDPEKLRAFAEEIRRT